MRNDYTEKETECGGINELADFFRLFSDNTRLRILCSLSDKEKYVQELSEELNISQSAVSHQLQILRAGRLVKYRRNGKSVIYSLDDDHIYRILNIGTEHVGESNNGKA